jgi:hypothetical protein
MKLQSAMLIGAAMICVVSTAGCLSIGGKTYTTHTNPDTEARLASLESRLSALEQTVFGTLEPGAEQPISHLRTP